VPVTGRNGCRLFFKLEGWNTHLVGEPVCHLMPEWNGGLRPF
jgi:hypothetical protein